MKLKFAAAAAIMMVSGVSLSFGLATPEKSVQPADKAAVVPAQEAQVKQAKDILSRLARQDGYMDEVLKILNTAKTKLTARDISALSLRLTMIQGNLDKVAVLNKTQFAETRPGLNLSAYTKTILSYSARINKKAARVGLLSAALGAKNGKTEMRDAVSSRGGEIRGKNITQLLEEQQAVKQLSADVKSFKSSAARLTAASKRLYIISK
ncbi:MAG: hypothetical protein NTX59_01550 [Elusimicrobia bacterium]|nr:hypothetical protein [Elusimicrobiota bacterium]